MALNREYADLVTSLVDVADFSAKQAAVEDKLRALALEPLLTHCGLIEARGLGAKRHDLILKLIRNAKKTQLDKVSKNWNPHRPGPLKEATEIQLIGELCALLTGAMQPAIKPQPLPKPPNQPKAPRASGRSASKRPRKSPAAVAAE